MSPSYYLFLFFLQYMGRIRRRSFPLFFFFFDRRSFPLLVQIESRGGEFEVMLPETLWDVGPFSDKMHFEISFLTLNITIIVLKRKLKIEGYKGNLGR
jgi:hypothetical protein